MGIAILGFIAGIITTIIGGLLTALVYDYFKDRPAVRRITKPTDKDLLGFLDVHEKLFPENQRSPPENFPRWLQERIDNSANIGARNRFFLLVAKIGRRVAGVMTFDYELKSKYIFVNLIGVDKEALKDHEGDRRFISQTLLKRFQAIVIRHCEESNGILSGRGGKRRW